MEKLQQPGGKKETEQGIDREYLQATQGLLNYRKEGVQTGVLGVSEGLYLDDLLKTAHTLASGKKVSDEEVGLLLGELGYLAARNYEDTVTGLDPEVVINDKEMGKQAVRQFLQTYEKLNGNEGEFPVLSGALTRARRRMDQAAIISTHFTDFAARLQSLEKVIVENWGMLVENTRIVTDELTVVLNEIAGKAYLLREQKNQNKYPESEEAYESFQRGLVVAMEGMRALVSWRAHEDNKMTQPIPLRGPEAVVSKDQLNEQPTRILPPKNLPFTQPPFVELGNAKTLEAIKSAMTPEVMRRALSRALFDIDQGIAHAKAYAEKNPGSILNKKTLALMFGTSIQGNEGDIYRKIGIVKLGREISGFDLAGMSPVDFLKDFFDYDLFNDTERASALHKYTNVFM